MRNLAKATVRTPVDEAIERALPRIIEACQPDLIILYGSRAYGTPREDSDIDLLVITDAPRDAAQRALHTGERIPGPRLSAMGWSSEDARSRLILGDPLLRDAVRAGRVLYDRTGQGLDYLREPPAHLVEKGVLGLNPLTEEWLENAEEDRFTVRLLLANPETRRYGVACFHAQQSAEKHLKALLQERGTPPPRPHGLGELLALVRLPDLRLQELAGELEKLAEFAVDPRYPGLRPTVEQAHWAIDVAERVRAIVRQALGLPSE